MKDLHLEQAQIIGNTCIAPDIFSMNLAAPGVAAEARPGQFVMVYLGKADMLLPRPISLCDICPASGTIRLVYQVVGAGTKVMSEMCPEQNVQLFGPLGNGFWPESSSRVALVGGGIGTPPLLPLAKSLSAAGVSVDVYLGFRSTPILVEEFRAVANNVFISTEDGSVGHHGYITEALREQNVTYDEIFACGPKPLLRALADFAAEKSIPCQVSVEERMACGVGTCVGCVVKVGETYVRVCAEGPVFDSTEVDLS